MFHFYDQDWPLLVGGPERAEGWAKSHSTRLRSAAGLAWLFLALSFPATLFFFFFFLILFIFGCFGSLLLCMGFL